MMNLEAGLPAIDSPAEPGPDDASVAALPCGTEETKPADSPTLRAFALIEHLVAADGPVSLAGIAHDVDMPKASLHRMLASLEAAGLLSRAPDHRNAYVIGPRLARLGLGVVARSGARRLRRAILARLVAELGETCNLTMLHGADVLYLDRVETAWPLRLDLKPGSRVPAYCSASGKLMLALLPDGQRAALLRTLVPARYTPNTIVDPVAFEAELDRVAGKGIALDNEEFVAGVICVAVPVMDTQGHCIAAIAMHAPVSRMPLSRALEYVPRLQDAARELAPTF
jgi:IclR family acetate operon transcriptional repressor